MSLFLGGGGELGEDASMLPFLFWRVSIGRRRSPPSGAAEVSRGDLGVTCVSPEIWECSTNKGNAAALPRYSSAVCLTVMRRTSAVGQMGLGIHDVLFPLPRQPCGTHRLSLHNRLTWLLVRTEPRVP